MDIRIYRTPLSDTRKAEYSGFLEAAGLRDEGDSDLIAWMSDDSGRLCACGSLAGHTLKQFVTSPSLEGTGAMARVMTSLIDEAYAAGITRLFLCTKPANAVMLGSLGFHTLVTTEDAVLMENRRGGLERFLERVKREADDRFKKMCHDGPPEPGSAGSRRSYAYKTSGTGAEESVTAEHDNAEIKAAGESFCRRGPLFGAVVCNCDPFTIGHRHLIEYASSHCDFLYVFAVSEPGSMFSAADRLAMIKAGTSDIKNCAVFSSDLYLVSRATFPAYFIRDEKNADRVKSDMDIELFAGRVAPALGIRRRFAGEEPYSPVTRAYNERMKELLPASGIELIEIPRLEADITASGGSVTDAPAGGVFENDDAGIAGAITLAGGISAGDMGGTGAVSADRTGGTGAVSAGRVRELIRRGGPAAARGLVPPAVYDLLTAPAESSLK